MSKDIPVILNIVKLDQSCVFQTVCMYLNCIIDMMQIEKICLFTNDILVTNYQV
jgi:hypothetical protein